MNWLRKYKNTILLVVVAGFLISTFVGFGLYIRSGAGSAMVLADVNEEKIPYRLFQTLYNQVLNSRRDKGEDLTPEIQKQIKQEVVQGLIQESVFFQESKRYGIEVTDTELAQALTTIPAFQRNGKFDVAAYGEALRFKLRTTPEDFEESQRRQIAINRLRWMILQSIKMTVPELDEEFAFYITKLQGKEKEEALQNYQKNKSSFLEKFRQEQALDILNRWYQQLGNRVRIRVHLDEIEKRIPAG